MANHFHAIMEIPSDIAIVASEIIQHSHLVTTEELALIETARPRRKLEFITGRHCAKLALKKYLSEPVDILIGKGREPLWPGGYVGSISHCQDLAVAAVASGDNYLALGIDVENISRANEKIASHICSEQELESFNTHYRRKPALNVLTIFSLKEAIFKCIYQATGIRPGFKELALEPDSAGNRARIIHVSERLNKIADFIRLSFGPDDDHIYSLAILGTKKPA